MKILRYIITVAFFIPISIYGQEIALKHSGTQYDAFENPEQSGFEKDLSKRNAISIFPAFHMLFNFKGVSSEAFKELLFTQSIDSTTFSDIGLAKRNRTNIKTDIYLFTYRILKSEKNDKELGFSVQLREDGRAKITNETFALIQSFNNFATTSYQGIINNKGINQSYWQFNINYRQKINDQWAFGGKVGLIDGITYNKIAITSSDFTANTLSNSYTTKFVGNYYSSFGTDTLKTNQLFPDLKNLGLSLSAGIAYTSSKGYYFTANIKDLGFIHWNKKTSVEYSYNNTITIANASSSNADDRLNTAFTNIANNNPENKSLYSSINTKIDVAVSKRFKNYMPVFVISKSTFRSDGQIGLLNNFKWRMLNLGINPIYDFNSGLNLGTQLMLKSPNMEFYVGSEALKPTLNLINGIQKNDMNIVDKTPRASFYMGLTIKFEKKDTRFWSCK